MEELPTAEQFWAMDDPWIVGRIFFDRISPDHFPRWASRILRVCWSRCPAASPAIEALVRLQMESQDWSQAKGIYNTLHQATLEAEGLADPSDEDRIRLRFYYLAEAFAKVSYNRSNPPDPFSDDAGHWIAGCLKEVADRVGDEKFKSLAWSALNG